MKAFILILSCSIVSLLSHPRSVMANIGDTYGFGSKSASLGAASVGANASGFSSYVNPAQLGLMKDKKILLDYGVLYMTPSFTPIQNVVVENNWASDKTSPRYSDVSTDYKDTFGQVLGAGFLVAPDSLRLGVGATFFFPLAQTAYVDSGEAFVPEYVLHRARTQRPQIELGMGAPLGETVSLGIGLHTSFAIKSEAKVFMQTSSDRPSYVRQSATAKPVAAPFFGAMFTPSSTWSFGSVLRLPLTTRNESRIDSGTGVFTGYPALDANFDAEGAAFYDPLTLELGTQIQTSESSKLLLEVDFQAWSKYETPYLKLSNPSGVIVSTGNVPVYQTRDILIPRVGHEIDLETWKLRAGYSYKPSIFSSLPTGAGNYLDPPSHRFAAGAGIKFDTFLGFASPYFLDFHLSYCHLASQTITKTAGNEGGVASDSKIGAPGYTAGGKIWGGGVSLSLEL